MVQQLPPLVTTFDLKIADPLYRQPSRVSGDALFIVDCPVADANANLIGIPDNRLVSCDGLGRLNRYDNAIDSSDVDDVGPLTFTNHNNPENVPIRKDNRTFWIKITDIDFYEFRLNLPDGTNLLTTVANGEWTFDYQFSVIQFDGTRSGPGYDCTVNYIVLGF